jgi:Domain of unknown function (DUF4385)
VQLNLQFAVIEVMTATRKPSYLSFDHNSYAWKAGVDYRKHPERYRVGKGEQGVLICEPYKSELVAHWRFSTPQLARKSSRTIYKMFQDYLSGDDFVGADMARKFLQMGFTRARRYTNYKGGKKYDSNNDYSLNKKGTGDPKKAESAEIFYKAWKKAEAVTEYSTQKKEWRETYG